MSEPQRIQRKRTKGWRMPENTVYVGRGSRWGNHWQVVESDDGWGVKLFKQKFHLIGTKHEAARLAVEAYENNLHDGYTSLIDKAPQELAGKNLACWCPLDQPCHADVLLEIANKEHE